MTTNGQVTIPDEAVEAAAIAMHHWDAVDDWAEASDNTQAAYRTDARIALKAALPIVREQIARGIESHAKAWPSTPHDWQDGLATAASIARGGAA